MTTSLVRTVTKIAGDLEEQMKGYSALLAAALIVTAAAYPAIADAAQRHGGGGGGRAAVSVGRGGGGGAGRAAIRAAPRAHFSAPRAARAPRAAVRSTTRSHVRAQDRSRAAARSTRELRANRRANARAATATDARRNATRAERRQARQDRTARQNRQAVRQAARQGRFASRVRADRPRWRVAHRPARWAWRHHGWRAGFVGWYGPLFWPYAYADIFSYTFWPWGYDDGYWYYAYDDFFDGVFYGDYGAYAAADGTARRSTASASYASVEKLCKQPGDGITAWPFADIEKKVGLTDQQKPLLDDLKSAAKKASDTFAAACPAENNFAATPPGRLEAMTARLQATEEAVQTVKPALEAFYGSLTDEQKERFNQLGPKPDAAMAALRQRETVGAAASETQAASDKQACGEAKPDLTSVPLQQVEATLKPTEAQQAEFKALQDATSKAVETLQAACPDEVPLTPTGRLDAMDQRLKAMIEAANTVKPALDSFYGSLSDEQKARFNRLDRAAAGNG
jgi:hypothetical protein